jgi:hypothetical protein
MDYRAETKACSNTVPTRSEKFWRGAAAQLSLISLLAIAAVTLAAGCGGVTGTYSDPTGGVSVELKSGGAATFTFAGQSSPCTYTTSGKQVSLTCQGQTTVFTIQDDGSLAGPPGSIMPPLKKK